MKVKTSIAQRIKGITQRISIQSITAAMCCAMRWCYTAVLYAHIRSAHALLCAPLCCAIPLLLAPDPGVTASIRISPSNVHLVAVFHVHSGCTVFAIRVHFAAPIGTSPLSLHLLHLSYCSMVCPLLARAGALSVAVARSRPFRAVVQQVW
jgi:hypothetical protein